MRFSNCSGYMLAILMVLIVFGLAPVQAQYIQQGAKLSASGVLGPANQGIVALSADGNTALVGGPADAAGVGAVWVWTRSASIWTQQSKLIGSGAVGNAGQGVSVALSGDGNTAIIGGFLDQGGTGAAWVWTRRGNIWRQEGNKLVGSGAAGSAYQGYSVALSTDGNTALVGGYNDAGGVGAVWVWTRSGGVWTQQGGKLIGTGAVGRAYQGYSVALSADGNTALAGGFADDSGIGAAWLWTRTYDTWTQQGAKLVGTGAVGPAYQGISVALSANGNTAMIGGFTDNNGAGAIWAWTRSAGVWKQQGNKLVGAGAAGGAYQGVSVALSANGNTAFTGGFIDNGGNGAVWVWTRTGGVWSQQGAKLVGTGAEGHAGQGRIVAISGDGSTGLAGGAFDDQNTGAVWVYVLPVDVSGYVTVTQSEMSVRQDRGREYWTAVLGVTNTTENDRGERGDATTISGPINIVLTGLTRNVTLVNRTGMISGSPYITVPIETLSRGQSINVPLTFTNGTSSSISFKPVVYTGTGALY